MPDNPAVGDAVQERVIESVCGLHPGSRAVGVTRNLEIARGQQEEPDAKSDDHAEDQGEFRGHRE
jgi:hypothetical protein